LVYVIKCLSWIVRILGYLIIVAITLAIASPGLLLFLLLLGGMTCTALVALGCALGLVVIVAYLVHVLLGLPFWLWMIFAGPGALLLLVAMLANGYSDGAGATDSANSQSVCSPFPLLMTALLLNHWWGEHSNV
jgi:hypothetical protein